MGSLTDVFFWNMTLCILLHLHTTRRHTPKDRTVSTHRSRWYHQNTPACFLTSQWSFLPYNPPTAQVIMSYKVRIYDLFTYATPPQHYHIWSVLYKATLNALCGGPARPPARTLCDLERTSRPYFVKTDNPQNINFTQNANNRSLRNLPLCCKRVVWAVNMIII